MLNKFEFQVENSFHKKRLDEFLFNKFSSLSKMYLRDVMNAGLCEVNGFDANSGIILRKDDFVEIKVDLERETAMKPQNIPLDVIFEDQHFVIVNKPAGMLVHPTHREKNGTLLNGLAHYLNIGIDPSNVIRPGLVHRLDKQTSGLLAVTKTQRALKILTGHFKRKLVKKRYFALVEGVVEKDAGEISAPIGRFADEKYWGIKEDGKHAHTRFWVKERSRKRTLLELEPVTGRTNQLRIHSASIGHPIVGDVRYGADESARLCLHAYSLEFRHPNSNEIVHFTSEMPAEFNCG